MAAPKEILDLLERFDRNRETYRSGNYNETQLRREFLDPFFKALGWDVENTAGHAEAYKDVIHEDAIKVGGATKAPDYCFRIGGTRKFFVEAKKPSVNIAEGIEPAYQLRRYAWSAKLPLSILTDFEEFAVYDCRIKPDKGDKASTARIMYLTERDYLARWEEIAAVFSKDAVLKGSFDKYADSARLKKGTAGVDAAFLKEIETWREMLARNIALRNPKLSQRELNAAVTLTINRIIFLRICEDRGVETYGQLMALKNGSDIYERLIRIYYAADDKYNSGLFHFRAEKDRIASPDTLTLNLAIDDKTLKDIFDSLYYPESPYEFSVLPADILGQVYEQFLGKIIHLTAGHRATVEDKPEVKKAGGVYYTPTYIVDYIVKNTVGKLLPSSNSNGDSTPAKSRKAVTPRQAAEIRILDPACGSGSFLLGAYQYLLDWHLAWYVDNDSAKWTKGKSPVLCQGPGGDWWLTTTERKRILLNNIYGVDIDAQAVEVTKLSLLLKVLEGENEQTLSNQLRLFRERALPDLANNIKCGNSLIGPDFYDNQQIGFFDDEERYRINCFDWEKEFPEIFASKSPSPPAGEGRGEGGFDAVIGNPPYVRIQGFPHNQIDYLSKRYRSAKGNFDLYISFVERGFELLKSHGLLGKIIPNKFFKTDYGEGLRDILASKRSVRQIIDFGANQVFEATTYTCLLFLAKQENASLHYAVSTAKNEALLNPQFIEIDSDSLCKGAWLFVGKEMAGLLEKVTRNSKRLLDLPADMGRGSSSGNDEVFVFKNNELDIEPEILRIPVFATDFSRYRFSPSAKWRVIFPYILQGKNFRLYTEEELEKRYPKVYAYLVANQVSLKKRKQYSNWYGFSAPRNLKLHDKAQIFIPLLANRGVFTRIPQDMSGKLCPMASGGFTITISSECNLKPEYVLALLNSRLLFWMLERISNIFQGGWITCTKQYFGELPIRTINFSDPTDKASHDRMVALVEQMLSLNKKLAEAKTDHEKTNLQRQIEATDRQIDRLVYDLYELTDEEIRIVEGTH